MGYYMKRVAENARAYLRLIYLLHVGENVELVALSHNLKSGCHSSVSDIVIVATTG